MLRKIEKYFSKFENGDEVNKDMQKKALIIAPITWEKLIGKCEKTGSLVYVFISSSNIFGIYHN
jgi:hypothetical protein